MMLHTPRPRIGIIGAGFGALAVAIELKDAGYEDLVLWERSEGIGGVWRDNTYPGAGCDVPSPLYSFSFAPNPDWSRRYALRDEIYEYIQHVACLYDISSLIEYEREVVTATYDEDHRTWDVTFSDDSSTTVDLVVSAVGQLSRPALPSIEGIDSFEGTTFHSAQWDHNFVPDGERIAVIGAGASAVQFVPHLAQPAAELTIFARSANYLLPKPDLPYGTWRRKIYHRFPASQRLERIGLWVVMEQFARGLDARSRVGKFTKALAKLHLLHQVPDPVLRAKLTPDYPIGCKRILFSNNFYPTLSRNNVDVITTPIDRVTTDGVATEDGREREFDAIVYATGFDAQDFLSSIDVTGARGTKLADMWSEGAHAYLGAYIPNFPNLFMMYGPNTNLGGGSIIYMLEAQARHIRQVLDRMQAGNYRAVEVTASAERAYDEALQAELDHSVWGSCDSWYRHPSGRITSNWPGATLPFAKRTKHLDPSAFAWIE